MTSHLAETYTFLVMSEEIKEYYLRGKELFENGLYSEAEVLLKKVLQKKPRYADVLNKLGVINQLKGNTRIATKYFEKALEINPRYTEAALNLAITLSDTGKTEKAQKILLSTAFAASSSPVKIEPFVAGKLANEHFKLGNMYYDLHLIDKAIEQYQRAVELRPGLVDIQTKLGMTLREKGLHEEAMACFAAAKKANPAYAPAIVQLGLSHYLGGNNELAAKEWASALAINPGMKEAKTFLRLLRKEE